MHIRPFAETVVALLVLLVPPGCQSLAPESVAHEKKPLVPPDEAAWRRVQADDYAYGYENYLKRFPESKHAAEAGNRIRVLQFQQVSRPGTSGKEKQEFIAKHPGTKEAEAAAAELKAMAVVEIEYTPTVKANPSHQDRTPSWHLRVVLRETNGVGARYRVPAISGSSREVAWSIPYYRTSWVRLQPKSTRNDSFFVRGKKLQGGYAGVRIEIEDDNGHRVSELLRFQLK